VTCISSNDQVAAWFAHRAFRCERDNARLSLRSLKGISSRDLSAAASRKNKYKFRDLPVFREREREREPYALRLHLETASTLSSRSSARFLHLSLSPCISQAARILSTSLASGKIIILVIFESLVPQLSTSLYTFVLLCTLISFTFVLGWLEWKELVASKSALM